MTTPGTDPRFEALAELALGTLAESERAALEAWLPATPTRRRNSGFCASRSGSWLSPRRPSIRPYSSARACWR